MSYRNPSLSQRPQLNTERPRWRITEGRGGVIQQRDESASQIARVFSQDGALLAEAEAEAHGQDPRLADTEHGRGVGVVGRLLRKPQIAASSKDVVLQLAASIVAVVPRRASSLLGEAFQENGAMSGCTQGQQTSFGLANGERHEY